MSVMMNVAVGAAVIVAINSTVRVAMSSELIYFFKGFYRIAWLFIYYLFIISAYDISPQSVFIIASLCFLL